jgi:hypothetical protein
MVMSRVLCEIDGPHEARCKSLPEVLALCAGEDGQSFEGDAQVDLGVLFARRNTTFRIGWLEPPAAVSEQGQRQSGGPRETAPSQNRSRYGGEQE